MQPRLFWNAVVLAFCAATTTLMPQAGRAAIVESIFFLFDGGPSRVGQISFPAISGNDVAGVDLFLFGGFITEADITSINWVLDPVNFAVLSLDLHAFHGDNPCPADVPCHNFTLDLSASSVVGVGFECTTEGCGVEDLFPTAVEFRVPEPGGFAILAVGLSGMGMVFWRTRRKGRPRPVHAVAG
jgi:hypothetical protein